jgi:hypothetical protein
LQVVEAITEVMNITGGQVGTGGGVAVFAHIGGFVLGALIALIANISSGRPPVGTVSLPAWPTHPALRASASATVRR